jgi:hypothetical protein
MGGKLVGFISAFVLTPSDQIPAMLNDGLTFCLDTSSDNSYRTSARGKLRLKPASKSFPANIFWQAEDYGLVPADGYSDLPVKGVSADTKTAAAK